MQAVSRLRVWLAFLVIAFPALTFSAMGQDEQPAAWQDVITSQIQAFRDHDAPAALSYAGRGFQATFPSPEAFFISIMSSGYAPIMESRSHTFGDFTMVGEVSVAQEVSLVGKDQKLYRALYLLAKEESGWRVQGVRLAATAAVGI